MNILETLSQRGLVSQKSDAQLARVLEKPATLYIGFDPTAESMHIGNLLQIIMLSHFQRHGHRPICVVGGGTAMIGDPSGKSEERNLLGPETIERNMIGMKRQLQRFLDFDGGPNSALMVNNAEWLGKFTFIEFLRDVGKHFRLGEMLGKESVRKRLHSEAGLSFTEFCYQLLQAYDFLHLSRQYDCILQAGGDDQWGNIIAGIELARKLDHRQLYALTSPLITTAAGQKFGKTETGTVWLDPDKTRPYDFYQYWIRTDDRDVVKLLKYFTFLPIDQIAQLEKLVHAEPEKRQAQKILAQEVTKLVHGPEPAALAQKAAQILFGEKIAGLSDGDLNSIFADVPSTYFDEERLVEGIDLSDALCETKICPSRSTAKKLIRSGGVYLNNERVNVIDYKLTHKALASENILVLRTGKKKYHLCKKRSKGT
ncbi:MAG: tyrosine--tRNA ligase [Phycisphaerae bacterium SM23_30]|nr:MAG: tyrosine--tRNA ligase [Phycisphaerae bacterium SM23_30]